MKDKGFTLIEVMIAFSIFIVVIGLVFMSLTNTFNAFHRAQSVIVKEQKQRLCMFRLSRELSSFTQVAYPQVRFKGEQDGFFLSSPERIVC